MLQKLVDTEKEALKKGKSRKEAIYAANDRFYKGDIAKEFVRGSKEQGGLITEQDLANWKVVEEEPMTVNYRGIDVYKLQQWTQGPMLLQGLNMQAPGKPHSHHRLPQFFHFISILHNTSVPIYNDIIVRSWMGIGNQHFIVA